ncbi:putative reverse transcriptase domain-containing protein [Tanacetum coccineum]|uniref:Reverse transcriptase domain-containing protein n=1 Tax=Tanacetum coccineum TaxID=301880 RepID=A0ABQ5HD52_9ASTR
METNTVVELLSLLLMKIQQDLNVVTSTFSLNDHFATVLFDSGVDFSFISTELLLLINAKPIAINPGYEIERANGLKIETNKIVHERGLGLEGYTFIIDLILCGHDSFDVIVGMDWLFKLKEKIVCYEKKVQTRYPTEIFWKFTENAQKET